MMPFQASQKIPFPSQMVTKIPDRIPIRSLAFHGTKLAQTFVLCSRVRFIQWLTCWWRPHALPRFEFGRANLIAREIPFMQGEELGLGDLAELLALGGLDVLFHP